MSIRAESVITQRPKEDPITGETDVSPEFSVVIPTYNRVATLARSLEALRHARASWRWEVIVVIDGSTDETESYLQQLNFPCPLTAVLQPNSGAGAARNHGASRARGLFILFLDDDMTVDDNLLVEHHKVLTQGADAVVGDMPVHPDTPPSLLRAGVERWARKRRVRLERTKGRVTPDDFLTGQLSVRRDAFFAVGGFDVDFNANGTFGGEDVDFLHRFQEAGYKLQYSAAAKSYQRYVVTPEQYLRQ
jgi:glycosyltransferase involved in cell wall biosynthesis